jgi:hypothetical protein
MSSFVASEEILRRAMLPLHDGLWGDMVLEDEANPELQRAIAAQRVAIAAAESRREVAAHQNAIDNAPWDAEILEGWAVPDLTLRKGIWENFPVDVKPLRSTDGTERYCINWNEAKCDDARAAADSMEHYSNFEDWTEHRLRCALEAHPHKYIVEPPRNNTMICVIAMVHAAPKVELATAPVVKAQPTKARALDILRSGKFHVSWDREDGSPVHYIKLHVVNAARAGATANSVRNALEAALSACSDCTVARATGKYMLVVTML